MRKSGEVRAEEDEIENPLLMAISIAAATSIDCKSSAMVGDGLGVGGTEHQLVLTLTHHPSTSTMMRSAFLLALAIGGGADAFKFMSNFQPAKILTNDQKMELAKTKERFGDKSK